MKSIVYIYKKYKNLTKKYTTIESIKYFKFFDHNPKSLMKHLIFIPINHNLLVILKKESTLIFNYSCFHLTTTIS